MKVTEKRVRFLQESLKLIHEKGFKATTMRDLAERMGFEVGNIYNYTKSKQALLENFLFGISEEFHAGIDQIIASSFSCKEKLRLVIRLHVQLTAQKPYEIALLVNEWRNLKEEDGKLQAFIKERNEYENKVKSIIQQGVKLNEFQPMDIEIATFAVLSCVRWLFDKYTQQADKMNPIELEKQLTDFIFKGLLL